MEEIKTRYDLCEAFLEAFKRCDPETEEIIDPSKIALPAIICASFSIEIGLKILLDKCEIKVKGHDLLVLFNLLPRHIQLQIIDGTCFPEQKFMNELNKSKLAFVEWRYIYEREESCSVNYYFLGKLATTVQTLVNCAKVDS